VLQITNRKVKKVQRPNVKFYHQKSSVMLFFKMIDDVLKVNLFKKERTKQRESEINSAVGNKASKIIRREIVVG